VAAWTEKPAAASAAGNQRIPVADPFPIPVVIDARNARLVQKTLMHSRTLWNGTLKFLVMHITN
jgi:hypothetical protein